MGTLLDAARKSAKLQVALSFLVGLAAAAALLLFAGAEDKDLVWKMPAVGVAAFVGALLFLSRTPQEIAAELSDQERRRQFESVARSIEQIESLARRSSWKATVNQPVLEVVQTARGTLDDLRQEFDAVRLQEFAGYLADFTDALHGYQGVLSRSITVQSGERERMLALFENNLPLYLSGFQALAAHVDQSKALLAQAKAQLLKNKMQARGRISTLEGGTNG